MKRLRVAGVGAGYFSQFHLSGYLANLRVQEAIYLSNAQGRKIAMAELPA